MKKILTAFVFMMTCFAVIPSVYALPFNITPKAGTSLPTEVLLGSTVTAYYTIQNTTLADRNNNFIKYLPPHTTQVISNGTYPDTCGATFHLGGKYQANNSCTLQLTINGAISANDTNPQNNLFACFPKGKVCAGTLYPLNVILRSSSRTLTSISITPTNQNIAVNDTVQYTAIGHYSDNTTANITSTVSWQVSNGNATINSSGLATAVQSGTTNITATLNGITSNIAIISINNPLVSIAVTPTNTNMNPSDTQQFTAIGTYANNATANLTNSVTWQASNANVSINASGLATAVQSGTTNITASLNGITSNSASVTVNNPFVSIAVTPTSANLNPNATQQFTAIGTYADSSTLDITNTATWQASNIKASVNSSGLATALHPGTVDIIASLSGITSNAATITVNNPLISIAITPLNTNLNPGGTQQFTAIGTYADSSTANLTNSVTWQSNNANASINASGLATANQPGNATITATLSGVTSNMGLLSIANPLVSIAITPTNPSLNPGATQQFTAIGTYTDTTTQNITANVTWHSNNGNVTINNAGLATAVSPGSSSNITASLSSITSNTAVVTVTNPLMSIAITPTNVNLNPTDTQQFAATGTYADSSTSDITSSVNWQSNSAHATINASGLATAVSTGNATITADLSGITSNMAMIAIANPLVSIAILPTTVTLHAGQTQQFSALGTYSDSSTQDLTSVATWQSSTGATTINSQGLATAVITGSSSITATLSGITSNSASFAVITYSYVANFNGDNISFCNVNSNQTFSGCTNTSGNFFGVTGIAINPLKTYMYTSNQTTSDVTFCAIANDGSLNNCAATGSTFLAPLSVTIDPNGAYAYIGNLNSTVSVCTINIDGTLSNCSLTGSGFNYPVAIHFTNSGTRVYIANYLSNLISFCDVNPNGTLTGCATTGTGFTFPSGIDFNNDESIIYITDNGSNTVRYCTLNANGTLNACTSTGTFDYPVGIDVAFDSTFAFITNQNNNTVSYCSIAVDHSFSSCSATGSGFNQPVGIVIY